MADAHIPGLAVAVTLPGEVIWTGAYGLANLDSALPVTVDTPFMLASVSKTVTGVAIMHASEENALSLDQDINTLLPFTIDNPRVDEETIELRHLVSHTSGIQDNWNNMPYFGGDSEITLGDYLEGYLVEGGTSYSPNKNYYNYAPGTDSDYGNIATALAGYVVETTTNTPFDDYCDDNIFDVLGMDNTGWHLEDFDATTVAMPYKYNSGDFVAYGHYGYSDYPSGQLRSSISDIARFLATISNDGSYGTDRILQPETVVEMLTPPVTSTGQRSVDLGQYVFWYRTSIAERAVIGHNGGDEGVATEMVFSPDTGIGVIILINTDWHTVGGAASEIQNLLFDRAESL